MSVNLIEKLKKDFPFKMKIYELGVIPPSTQKGGPERCTNWKVFVGRPWAGRRRYWQKKRGLFL